MFDVTIFTALGWERRAVTGAVRSAEPSGLSGAWRGRLADGASCLVVQTGIGRARAAAAAAAAPPAGAFLACGCAGALVGGLAAAARARGIPFAALRVVLDGAGEVLPAGLGVIDEATGEVRAGRALAAMVLHPRLWPAAARLARQQRLAARRLGAIMAALEVEAVAAPREAATAAGI